MDRVTCCVFKAAWLLLQQDFLFLHLQEGVESHIMRLTAECAEGRAMSLLLHYDTVVLHYIYYLPGTFAYTLRPSVLYLLAS